MHPAEPAILTKTITGLSRNFTQTARNAPNRNETPQTAMNHRGKSPGGKPLLPHWGLSTVLSHSSLYHLYSLSCASAPGISSRFTAVFGCRRGVRWRSPAYIIQPRYSGLGKRAQEISSGRLWPRWSTPHLRHPTRPPQLFSPLSAPQATLAVLGTFAPPVPMPVVHGLLACGSPTRSLPNCG